MYAVSWGWRSPLESQHPHRAAHTELTVVLGKGDLFVHSANVYCVPSVGQAPLFLKIN